MTLTIQQKSFCIGIVVSLLFGATADAQTSSTIVQGVPFTSQAPKGNWSDERQQNGCEEASALMAMYWVRGRALSPDLALQKILAIAAFQKRFYGSSVDTSANDTASRIIKGYFRYSKVRVASVARPGDIISELQKKRVVIVPVNGQVLKNPFYNPPGPLHHMLVIIGYDSLTKEFITNDPGTRRGKQFRYAEARLMKSLTDYPTGDHKPITRVDKKMIVVWK